MVPEEFGSAEAGKKGGKAGLRTYLRKSAGRLRGRARLPDGKGRVKGPCLWPHMDLTIIH